MTDDPWALHLPTTGVVAMTERIYYVGARLSYQTSHVLGFPAGQLGHATLIYSRKWFPYRQALFFPLIIEPPYTYDTLAGLPVLLFNSPRLFKRHIALQNAGGTWDYADFKAHISLGKAAPPDIVPNIPLIFSHEYYQTWEQDERR